MKKAMVMLTAACCAAVTTMAEVIRPDRVEAAEGVKVGIADDGTVSISSDGRVDEVKLVWNRSHKATTPLFRNDWERTYGEAGWTTVEAGEMMGSAWYCMLREPDGRTDGWGVEVQPNALCWWRVTPEAIVLTLDVRAGARPVNLKGRTLAAAKLVMRRGSASERAFAAGKEFCRLMCPKPRLPKTPVYGYNDWYCAYGRNTATNFLKDAKFVVSLCEGLENRPYVVMDDGWQRNSPPVVAPLGYGSSGWGPWDEAGDAFGMKMKPFAAAVAELGAKPGLWYRPYRAWEEAPEAMRLKAERIFFDPSAKGVTEQLAADVTRFREWGMKLVKIDYLVGDVAGALAFPQKVGGSPFLADRVWSDDSRTTCEVLLEQYRAMRKAAGDDVILIGCNAFDHLVAGIFELQRTGGDTSGRFWPQTVNNGVNTLAARSIHDGTFYATDADCVGLAWKDAIDWSLNSQWLDLVARSGTPLFVSWHRSLANPFVIEGLKSAFAKASKGGATAEPLDWERTARPEHWRFSDGSVADYRWDSLEAMGPGWLWVAEEKTEKALHSLYGYTHQMRTEYVVVPSKFRNAAMVDFGRARSTRTLEPGEVPDLDKMERFLDFSSTAKRTKAGEIANAICNAKPVMRLASHPAVYARDEAFDLLLNLPTVYDETRLLPGHVTARRAGNVWYVAVVNIWGAKRSFTVDLSFIGGERKMWAFQGTKREIRKTADGERLTFTLEPNDGFAARLGPEVSLFLMGDSTLSPRREWKPSGSWGEMLEPFLKDSVWIRDRAWGGRSTKSYRGLGHYEHDLIPFVTEGDWVIIQFGTNDNVKNQPYRSCTPYEYSTNLVNYVNEIRAKGGNPLLCSPITSRRWSRDGSWPKDYLKGYQEAAARVAAEMGVPYVDMTDLTSQVVVKAGLEESRKLFTVWFNGTDNVHPSKDGARRFAEAFVAYLKAHPDNAAGALLK